MQAEGGETGELWTGPHRPRENLLALYPPHRGDSERDGGHAICLLRLYLVILASRRFCCRALDWDGGLKLLDRVFPLEIRPLRAMLGCGSPRYSSLGGEAPLGPERPKHVGYPVEETEGTRGVQEGLRWQTHPPL